MRPLANCAPAVTALLERPRSEEHTSEIQSQSNLVCRPPLEKNKGTRSRCICKPFSALTFPNACILPPLWPIPSLTYKLRRPEDHTSELPPPAILLCRLLLAK